jgi:hypothetical protein
MEIFTAEALSEQFGMRGIGKTKDNIISIVPAD